MSFKYSCNCAERKKPPEERNWVVHQYKWNTGAFVRDGGEPSNYSSCYCKTCYKTFRTKAAFVDVLPLVSREEFFALVRLEK